MLIMGCNKLDLNSFNIVLNAKIYKINSQDGEHYENHRPPKLIMCGFNGHF